MIKTKTGKKISNLFITFLFIMISWTIIIITLILNNIHSEKGKITAITLAQARSLFYEIVLTRHWNAEHGGVYVPVTDKTQPNPYLTVSNRTVVTQSGQVLTLINPAFMTRQISEIAASQNNIQFHITSLNPLRPDNAPADWEAKALKTFNAQTTEFYEWWLPKEKKEQTFRYIAPLWTEKACLKCHAQQGYTEGDLRGGISVTIPLTTILAKENKNNNIFDYGYLIIWMIGIIGIFLLYWFSLKEFKERSLLIEKLETALKDVKTLKGFIPICATCKKIRNDEGYWDQVEKYIQEHSDAEFSHGMCPDCISKHYPWYDPSRKIKQEDNSRE